MNKKVYMKQWSKDHKKECGLRSAIYYKLHKEEVLRKAKERRKQYPEIATIRHMRERCNNPKVHNYNRYGGRGIKCKIKNWKEIVNHIGPKPGENWTIDRINTNGHYEIGNIRWATYQQQALNRNPRCSLKS